jgi:transposase
MELPSAIQMVSTRRPVGKSLPVNPPARSRLLLRKVSGKLLVLWDGSPIHRAEVIKQFLRSKEGKRLHLERLPGYAPDLNPQEQVWNLLKRRELKSLCCRDLAHVGQELVRAKERLRHRRESLQRCFTHALGAEENEEQR